MARGERFMTSFEHESGEKSARSPSPVSAFSTASPLRRLQKGWGDRGYNAGKKVTGRKRHILADTLGLIVALVVHPANIQDRDGGRSVTV